MSKKKDKKPRVHDKLQGFDIRINENGEVESTKDIDEINDFLDENVEDKKFKGIDIERKKDDKDA